MKKIFFYFLGHVFRFMLKNSFLPQMLISGQQKTSFCASAKIIL
ncbi:hypothetical protein OMAG_001049 [Candidatus Omnitrophus magneticus]|uniref:Uncharacterized protein n=1 Tax=Candidatus Omnitrophus magneticus TaxID=1609969 RepID=A0A0F0CUG6_9BACT|nr:hypothetical protein OMAG_001049 [Candidatus Omnitrophus magneticus]